ncbi:Hypothetical protein RBRH_04082 [Mycetohabitans rhizoxinica HKI 454]|uniref:Uncharacterized protein n=1 Tax=Mycetohabitans rhizoxinica (strain DSM 19002 / CIP 109453 / HKI 454) TaxID=882378 RepID=E5AN88_MYCRK|nr:Hypothetical protein RBRH_04082 [Mycetohabitans rhizoxinica HKI 454]
MYPGAAAALRRASSHWLRHTRANHALDEAAFAAQTAAA